MNLKEVLESWFGQKSLELETELLEELPYIEQTLEDVPTPEPTYQYIKIQFTSGLDCQAYQKINNYGQCVGYVDLNYQPLSLPEVTGSYVIQEG